MTVLGSPAPAALSHGSPRASGQFPLIQDTYTATGIRIPAGSLDRWFAARRNSANQLVEVAIFGDSTMFGQTLSGPYYSPITRLRALLAGDGYTDGGHGNLNGIDDTVDQSGSVDGLVLGAGFASSNVYVMPGESKYSDVAADNQTFTRIGRYCTLYYTRFNSGGRFTYEIDGSGTEVPVDPVLNAVGYPATFAKVYLDLGSDGTHTIKIRNKGGRLVGAPAYSAGSFAGSGTGGTLATDTYEYAAAFLTTGGAIGALGAVKTVTITLGQTFSFNVPAQLEGGATTNIYRRVAGVGNYKLIGNVATNANSAYAFNDTGAAAGADYAASAAPVLESASKWVNVVTVVTRPAGVVVQSWTARGSTSAMAATPYNLAMALGLDLEPLPTVAATDRAIDSTPGARRPVLAVFTHGINDQQHTVSDDSATTYANTVAGIQAAKHAGADVLVTIPLLESASNYTNASLYREALKAAAEDNGAAWIDIGIAGPFPTFVAGSTSNNPHLTTAQYQAQGDFIYGVLGAR